MVGGKAMTDAAIVGATVLFVIFALQRLFAAMDDKNQEEEKRMFAAAISASFYAVYLMGLIIGFGIKG